MVRAVIFDFYGVLAINGWQAFKEAHFRGREQEWKHVYQLGRQVDAGLIDYADFVHAAAEASGESEHTVRYQLEHTVANAELLDFIRTDLKASYKLGILSNASSDEVVTRVFTGDQHELFDIIIFSHHVGMTKPDVHMYKVAAQKLGVEAVECVFVDDQERHVVGAREAGMQALHFTSLAKLRRELAELL